MVICLSSKAPTDNSFTDLLLGDTALLLRCSETPLQYPLYRIFYHLCLGKIGQNKIAIVLQTLFGELMSVLGLKV